MDPDLGADKIPESCLDSGPESCPGVGEEKRLARKGLGVSEAPPSFLGRPFGHPQSTHQGNGVRLRRLMWFDSPLKGAASRWRRKDAGARQAARALQGRYAIRAATTPATEDSIVRRAFPTTETYPVLFEGRGSIRTEKKLR